MDSTWESIDDCIDALFNNGGKVLLPFETKPITTLVGYLPKMKANQYSLKKYMSSQSKGEMSYAFAISEVGELFKAVFCPDPLYQANERGYKLQ